ncbi:MAG: proline dehydrogenase family protein, partial [Bacteroidota bacterium]
MPQTHSPVSFDDIQTAFAHKNNQELRKTFWLYKMMNYPRLVRWGTRLLEVTLGLPPIQWMVRQTLFRLFVGGESLEDCLNSIKSLENEGVFSYLSFSSEGKDNETAYEATYQETLKSIDFCKANPSVPFAVFKLTGMASFDLLEQLGVGETLTPKAQQAWEKLRERVQNICQRAYDQEVKLFIDAEETWIQNVIDQLAEEMMEKYNQEKPIIYNTYQMYRKAGLDLLKNSFQKAQEGNYFLGVKIVRGAYMEKERARALRLNYPDPINDSKKESD